MRVQPHIDALWMERMPASRKKSKPLALLELSQANSAFSSVASRRRSFVLDGAVAHDGEFLEHFRVESMDRIPVAAAAATATSTLILLLLLAAAALDVDQEEEHEEEGGAQDDDDDRDACIGLEA